MPPCMHALAVAMGSYLEFCGCAGGDDDALQAAGGDLVAGLRDAGGALQVRDGEHQLQRVGVRLRQGQLAQQGVALRRLVPGAALPGCTQNAERSAELLVARKAHSIRLPSFTPGDIAATGWQAVQQSFDVSRS